jgi:2-desacetyl-2-hydroxyethyl bacteriochlorophyllide A dehydrogenase
MRHEDATMTAAVLAELPASGFAVGSRPLPRVDRADDVVLRVEACGVCGTDLHILAGEAYRPELPFVLGHEPVGVVIDAGPAARAWLGRRVTMTLFTGDGTCPACRAGDERLCPALESITGVFGADGAYAQYVRVHAAQLVAVPDTLSPTSAAALVDSGATAANSVRVALAAQPARALVLGAGPIGFIVAELLEAEGVAHQVVEIGAQRRSALAAAGHDVVESFAEAHQPVDVVIDCTGSPAVLAQGVAALAPHGSYVLAGYARVPEVDFAELSHREGAIIGVRSGRREDLERLIELVAAGRVRLPALSIWPLTQINEAIAALRAGDVPGKAVIVPDSEGSH